MNFLQVSICPDIQKILFTGYEAIVQHFSLAITMHVDDDGTMETYLQHILQDMTTLTNVRKKFLTHIFILFLSVRGRINFLNMARYGSYSEKSYRTHFEEPFAFVDFNTLLIQQICSPQRIIAADCTYLPKSGKATPTIGKFWNGCVGKAMPGLELSTLAVVDVEKHTAFHLESRPQYW